MISTHTQDRLARLLRHLAKGEQEIEIARQNLTRNSGFESYTCFKRIDRHADNSLSTVEVEDFLKYHSVIVTEKGLRNLFNAYSSQNGVRLTYTDFQKIVLPKTDNELANKCLRRKVTHLTTEEYLPEDIERALARLLQTEIEVLNKIEELKEDLSIRHDFGILDAFNAIDTEKNGVITAEDLYAFLNKNISGTRRDSEAILIRFDKNKDSCLNYSEFSAIVQPTNPNYPVTLRSTSPLRRSPLRSPRATTHYEQADLTQSTYASFVSPSRVKNSITNEDYKDYLRETARTDAVKSLYGSTTSFKDSALKRSYFESPSPQRITRLAEYESPLKAKSVASEYASSIIKRPSSPLREKYEAPTFRATIEKKSVEGFVGLQDNQKRDLARFLKDELDLDKNLQRIKNELALQRNFNSYGIFRIFDKDNKGYITRGQLETGLQGLNIFPSKNELYLLMRRLDKNDDGLIRFADFKEEIEPKAEGSKALRDSEKVDEEVGIAVRTVVRKLFNKMITTETSCEELRKSVGKKAYFTIYEAFHSIKKNSRGWITATTLHELLNEQGIYASEEDAELLVERYDRNRNGKISYNEFVDEIVQKLSVE